MQSELSTKKEKLRSNQKIKFCKVSIKDGTMLIEAKSKVDLTLEEWTFAGKATFFEEVYGLKAILERVSE